MSKRVIIRMNQFEIFKTITLLLIAVFLLLGVFWFGGTIVGYKGQVSDTYFGGKKPMIIVSGSMEPVIVVNSLLLLNNTKYDELNINDIIMFNTREYGLVIHRIVDKVSHGFITKGDNNELEDNWIVTESMYKGKVESIHNNFAPFISFLFGDLNNLNLWRILFGLTILVVLFSLFALFLCNLYQYIFLFYFLKKSSKLGGSNVINEYYRKLDLGMEKEEISKLFDDLREQQGLLKQIFLRYKIMKFHNLLYKNSFQNKKLKREYIKIRKDMEK